MTEFTSATSLRRACPGLCGNAPPQNKNLFNSRQKQALLQVLATREDFATRQESNMVHAQFPQPPMHMRADPHFGPDHLSRVQAPIRLYRASRCQATGSCSSQPSHRPAGFEALPKHWASSAATWPPPMESKQLGGAQPAPTTNRKKNTGHAATFPVWFQLTPSISKQ